MSRSPESPARFRLALGGARRLRAAEFRRARRGSAQLQARIGIFGTKRGCRADSPCGGPGLEREQLYEGRDLKPTRDLRAVLKGVLRDHLGVPDGALGTGIFPDSASAKALDGLVA